MFGRVQGIYKITVFQVRCPYCNGYFEVYYSHKDWPEFDKDVVLCPDCENSMDLFLDEDIDNS